VQDESATSSESSQELSTNDSSAATTAPGKTARTGKKRGKMYWKFAALEGWRAKGRQNQNANHSNDTADGAERVERMEKTTGTPGD